VLDEECYEIELGVVFKGLSPEELIV
jgi:hypothetical protein